MDIKDIRRENLRKWIAEHGRPAAEKSLFSQLLSGNGSFGERVARRLEIDYKMGSGFLDAQAGKEVPATEVGSSNIEAVTVIANVPLISWVQAGEWCEASDLYNVGDAEEWLSCPVRHGPKTYALRVRGESMRNPGSKPSFEDGDVIFVDPDLGASHKSLVITKLDQSNEVTFKRLLIDGTSWYLEALNPAWPSRIIPIQTDAHICGVVIARMESFI